ncbi:MAG: hypothetical protein ABJN42_07390 [Roseibium sp.]|uniref:hypothetical protein n=1 Tax=Roseibium sp. TaxID=1936156 RepID=UPI003296BAE0
MHDYKGHKTAMELHPFDESLGETFTHAVGRYIQFAYTVDDGELLQDMFPVSPSEDERAKLLDPDEVVYKGSAVRIVVDGQPDHPVYRVLEVDQKLTRGQLIDEIGKTYAEVQRIDEASGGEVIGLDGRMITNFFIEGIALHEHDEATWVYLLMGT